MVDDDNSCVCGGYDELLCCCCCCSCEHMTCTCVKSNKRANKQTNMEMEL